MGMAGSLAALIATSFVKSAPVHVAAGIAMIGFSAWHVALYKNSKKPKNKPKSLGFDLTSPQLQQAK